MQIFQANLIRSVIAAAVILTASGWTHSGTPSDPQWLANFDQYVRKGMSDWRIPGLAIAIVKDDQVVLLRGYGVRELGAPAAVDENTMFAIASDTKAFTGMALAMLADDKKLDWDDRVTRHIPWFQLSDPVMTQEMTVRDLITHRSGFARGDLLWVGGWEYDRAELVRRLRHLKPSWGFRSRYGYSNLMFHVAGEVAAAAAGESWDSVVAKRIFQPLGMTSTNTSVRQLTRARNVATPHAEQEGIIVRVPYTNMDNAAAAGAINSTAADMARWLRFQLDSGRVGGKRLVSARNFRETHTPQTSMRIDSAYRAMNPHTHLMSYAFGWRVQDYRGRELLFHAGNLSGMAAVVGLMPEERLGVVVLSNLEYNALRESLVYKVMDLWLRAPPKDWSAENLAEKRTNDSTAAVSEAKRTAKRMKGTRPSLDLRSYAGSYEDLFYGTAEVLYQNGKLVFAESPRFVGDMEHWHYDTFRVRWRDTREGTNMVTFTLDDEGKVESLVVNTGEPREAIPRFRRVR